MLKPIINEIDVTKYNILDEYEVVYKKEDKLWHVECISGNHIFTGAMFYDKFDALNWTARLAVDHHQGYALRELFTIVNKNLYKKDKETI